ncbi:MAG: hypothetical protein ACLGHC_02370 [Alphaproteobacteria bacterium]
MKPVLLAALPLASCASVPPAGVPVTGQWGGPHIGLTLDASGGRIEYDCATGTIGPVIPVAGGRFAADGTHTPEHGGPVREGEVLPTYRARFTGNVDGERMMLSGRVENGVELGPFTLRRGAEPGILRCL